MTIDGSLENQLRQSHRHLIGVDEVGRGCLAGPVYAAAVILDYERLFALEPGVRQLIRDSKTLSHRQRQQVLPVISELAMGRAIATASVDEIDEVGILKATFLAMKRAIADLPIKGDLLLVDGNQKIAGMDIPQKCVVGGDNLCFAIAAASIVAKEARDNFMREQGTLYPVYGFDSHVGYGTKAHMRAMTEYGITPLHRKSFAPVAKLLPSSHP